MSKAKERDEFIATLTRALPNTPAHIVTQYARLLLRHAKSHGNIAEAECNGHPAMSSPYIDSKTASKLQAQHEAWCEKRERQLERRMTQIAGELGVGIVFGGDPRGYTVKLQLPNGESNTWGRDGFGVPQ